MPVRQLKTNRSQTIKRHLTSFSTRKGTMNIPLQATTSPPPFAHTPVPVPEASTPYSSRRYMRPTSLRSTSTTLSRLSERRNWTPAPVTKLCGLGRICRHL